MMTLTELLPKLRELPRKEKLQVLLFLISEIAKEEGVTHPEASFSSVALHESFEAANILSKMLEDERSQEAKNA